MSLQLVVVFAIAVLILALTQGAPLSPKLQSRRGQRLFQSCNPHLRMPDGSRMEVDLVSYYSEVDPKCLGGVVMVTFNIHRRVKLFETKEDTAICHGFIELLSLIDAYNWTKEMCEEKAIADERGAFCKTYSARQKDIGSLTLKYNATGYNHLTVVSLLLSRMGEENCKEFCNGIMNSTLCNSFVDASSFFLRKYESDPPQKKIIIPGENNVSPESATAASLGATTPSEATTIEDTATPSKEPGEVGLEDAPPPSSSDEPTEEKKSETFPIEPQSPPEDTNMGTVLETILEEFDMTKEDFLAVLGPDFHGDLSTMTYEEVVDALDEADLDDEEDTLTPEELEEFEAWQKGGGDTDLSPTAGVPDKKPQEPVAESPEQKVNGIVELGMTKVEVKSGSYGSWHFLTIFLILAAVVIGAYLCRHKWKRDRKGKDHREAVVVKTFGNYW